MRLRPQSIFLSLPFSGLISAGPLPLLVAGADFLWAAGNLSKLLAIRKQIEYNKGIKKGGDGYGQNIECIRAGGA